jgi:hypothetical protein
MTGVGFGGHVDAPAAYVQADCYCEIDGSARKEPTLCRLIPTFGTAEAPPSEKIELEGFAAQVFRN